MLSTPQRKLFYFLKYQGATKEFSCGKEQQKAFKTLPTLARPMVVETLYLYVAASQTMISIVLIREENQIQLLIYFVSKTSECRKLVHNDCKDGFCSSYCNSKAPAIL